MPSSNKTANLLLNSWIGSDIPKREDFNADNAALDEAVGNLRRQVADLGAGGSDGPGLAAHLADTAAHLSAADRTALAGATPAIGTYTGDGNPFQGIPLGFRPRLGLVYAADLPVMTLNAAGSAQFTHLALVTRLGCTLGAETTSTGFKAVQSGTAGQSGQTSLGLNQSGRSYVYVMWP